MVWIQDQKQEQRTGQKIIADIKGRQWSRSGRGDIDSGGTDWSGYYFQDPAHQSGNHNFRENYQREFYDLSGEVTAFLTIVFVLLAGFLCSLVEAASIQSEKHLSRDRVDMAVYSVFGEYEKELWKRYRVFGTDIGYESGAGSEQTIENRIRYYGALDFAFDFEALQLLTDHQGEAFYRQAVQDTSSRYGIDIVKEFIGDSSGWKDQMEQGEEDLGKKNTLEDQFRETGTSEAPEFPVETEDTGNSQMLENLLPEEFPLSKQAVTLDEMPSKRELYTGYGEVQTKKTDGVTDRLLFDEYLLKNFSSALSDLSESGLSYEVEYVLGGKESDRKNLQAVAEKLILFRFAADYAYLLSDEEKKTEAEGAALTACTLLLMPEAAEVVQQLLLLLWAYREAQQDVRILLAGGKVSLVKQRDNWRVPLHGILKEKEGATVKTVQESEGLTYQDYLRILLFLIPKATVTMRALDILECGVRQKGGKQQFRVDLCMTGVRIRSRYTLSHGISYEFPMEFSYQ